MRAPQPRSSAHLSVALGPAATVCADLKSPAGCVLLSPRALLCYRLGNQYRSVPLSVSAAWEDRRALFAKAVLWRRRIVESLIRARFGSLWRRSTRPPSSVQLSRI